MEKKVKILGVWGIFSPSKISRTAILTREILNISFFFVPLVFGKMPKRVNNKAEMLMNLVNGAQE